MVRRLNLLTAAMLALVLAAVVVQPAAAAEPGTCTPSQSRAGVCPINDGQSVTLSESRQSEQESATGAGRISNAASANDWTRCVDAAAPRTTIFRGSCTGAVDGTGALDGAPQQPAAGAPGGVVTIDDVARFLPAAATLHSEPHGWAVLGVPANFWVEVQPVTVQAPLLGKVAEVRFTPVAYRWSYGDGTTRTTATPGATWAALGQEQLTPTATSHDYTGRGQVQAQVGVVYTATYRVGGGAWLPVVGAVVGDAPPVPMLVVAEHTVLTNGTDGG